MSDEFVPAVPGTWTLVALRESNHEAAHALAAVLLGIPVYEARIDNPDVNVRGHVVMDKDGVELWKAMVVSLAPLIAERRCPSSLDLMSNDSDVFKAAVRAHDAGLTANHYYGCVAFLEHLLFDLPSSRRALKALSSELLERGAITGAEARAIVEAETVKAPGAENGKAPDDARATPV